MKLRLFLFIANIIFVAAGAKLGSESQLTPDNVKHQTDEREIFDVRADVLPEKSKNHVMPRNCAETTSCNDRSGIHTLQIPQLGNYSLLVECDVKTRDGGWIIIQRRINGSLDFYRGWQEYKQGFGDVYAEYFIGLDNLYALTNFAGPQELLILMDDDKYASYSNFVIGSEAEKYVLKRIGEYDGTAGDSLVYHLGQKFTTKDQDNDPHPGYNCAIDNMGAWWYNYCHRSNLNGKYGNNEYGKGINWYDLAGFTTSLSYVQMMIRPRKCSCN